jgi:AhpD family alkylhydroperoxidase
MSTRVPGREPSPGDVMTRAAYAYSRRRFGKVMEPLAVVAHHRPLTAAVGTFELAVERGANSVPDRLKILGELKAALVAGCEFCIDIGSWIARDVGVTEAELRAFHEYKTSDLFSSLDRLVIDYAAGMSATPVTVSDELVAALREHLDEKQLVELTAVIAWENYRARFDWALGIGSQDFSEGAFCPRAE